MTDVPALDDLDRLRLLRREAMDRIVMHLRAPYNAAFRSAWATMENCQYTGHPSRRDGVPGECVCGKQDGWVTPPWET